jgi:hypothetical protein
MARDAGAAAALEPVLSAHEAAGGELVIAAYDRARPVLQDRDAAFLELGEAAGRDEIRAAIARHGVAALLTGTSARPERDQPFWEAARAESLPSVGLLDHWTSYGERFTIKRPFDALPDVVAVMDEEAARRLRELGAPPDRVVVTGHPHLDAVAHLHGDEPAAARAALGLAKERPVVVLASEPKARFYPDLTYDEVEVFGLVAYVLHRLEPGALLAVRPHPLEDRAWEDVEAPVETVVARLGTPRDWIAAADCVVGMTSVFLLEAARAGRATLSFTPGVAPEHFIEVHSDEIASATSAEELRSELASLLALPPKSVVPRAPGAAQRVLALLSAPEAAGARATRA